MAPHRSEFSIQISDEKSLPPLFVQSWSLSKSKSDNQLIYVHGLNDYGGRFERSIGPFLDAGFTVTAPDLFGHGKSRDNGRCLHGYVESMPLLLAAVDAVVGHVHRNHQQNGLKNKKRGEKTRPRIFMMGSSMGGLLALSYVVDPAMKHRDAIDGILPICPLLESHPESTPGPLALWLGRILRAIIPTMPLSPANRGKNHWDSSVEQEFTDDPETYSGWLRVGTGFALLDGMQWFQERRDQITKPFLLVHGTGDRVTDYRASESLYSFYREKNIKQENGKPLGSLVLLDRGEHAIWCGDDGKRCADACLSWLAEQLGA